MVIDEETRGLIEKALDEMIEKLDVKDIVGWILDEYPVDSLEDLAMGYVLGSLTRYAYNVVWKKKFDEKFDKKFDRKMAKELGKKELEELKKRLEERNKELKPIRVKMTKKELADITDNVRDVLKRSIVGRKREKVMEVLCVFSSTRCTRKVVLKLFPEQILLETLERQRWDLQLQ